MSLIIYQFDRFAVRIISRTCLFPRFDVALSLKETFGKNSARQALNLPEVIFFRRIYARRKKMTDLFIYSLGDSLSSSSLLPLSGKFANVSSISWMLLPVRATHIFIKLLIPGLFSGSK